MEVTVLKSNVNSHGLSAFYGLEDALQPLLLRESKP